MTIAADTRLARVRRERRREADSDRQGPEQKDGLTSSAPTGPRLVVVQNWIAEFTQKR